MGKKFTSDIDPEDLRKLAEAADHDRKVVADHATGTPTLEKTIFEWKNGRCQCEFCKASRIKE